MGFKKGCIPGLDIEMEQTYTWENFIQENEYQSLIDFFNEIFADKDSAVVFVSRKSYCLFLLLRRKNVIEVGNSPIYADRLIMKSCDPQRYAGEKVYLVDDTISTGNHLARVCRDVLRRTQYKNIELRVFIKDDGFQEADYVQRQFPDKTDRIKLKISLTRRVSQKLRFSSIETLLYHQENIPYFIELPYLKDGDGDAVLLTKEEYGRLEKGTDFWKFRKCDQSGYKQNIIENAVIIMSNSFVDTFPEFIHDFTVRVQIVTHEDKSRSVVLSPFAILKSIKFEDLEKIFFAIYEGTEYADILIKQKKDLKEEYAEYHYKTLYRAVVYAFSYYIGLRFLDFLTDILGRRLTFQDENNCFCYEDEFITSLNDVFKGGTKRFFLTTYLYKGFSSVERRRKLLPFIRKYGRLESDFRTIYHYLLALFNDMRENSEEQVAGNDIWQKFFSIEELQEAISLSCFEQNDDIKDILTGCICSMLEQSKIANEIEYDERRGIVYRGFKFAENSEAIFDIAEKAFYAAAVTYLEKVCEHQYEEKYERFLSVLKEFFIHNNLFGSIITSNEFQIYSEMYRKQSVTEKKKQMNRLEFLIEDKKPVYIATLIDYMKNVDWN